ncbi:MULTISPECIES: DUF2584 domain-containing protein [Halobacillus]|uniref:DUF2584 family protein n=1 Tax=Halobacillus halophilus (strain ATCC 35676 / DSM 2266 / JCM 20832 / KCTC 3685 / LMG 17431 / NBRC 102448 / NCIMB 2269) TaxID=866895 RepID=I0JN38_HALH3|nr:DUF2584 domain-containing protein [Halobacillus halophilus]ASF39625.1 hypothetical protein CEH05_10970 [Halobacillus halophilus]CCG45558.1 hypothetical protein HBHAL_3213 [Halobacillus halophilus DSM 2266]
MATPLSMEWILITNGKEQRLNDEDNLFEIVFEGYRIFPLNEKLEIKRTLKSEQLGAGIIEELTFKNHFTYCKYRLVSLHSVN